jgi:NAD-dependent SIR2 family protein deacetylase
MNIDGLHNQQACGLRWDPELHPTGLTVEMHGNVNEAVCEECAAVYPMEGAAVRAFRAKRNANCTVMRSCKGLLRPRIMFYADENEDLITQVKPTT